MVLMYKWDAVEALKLIERERLHLGQRRAGDGARDDHRTPTSPSTTPPACSAVGGGGAQLQPDLVDKIDKADRDRATQHRLRHDRDVRDHHLDLRRLLRRQAGQLRPRDADLRGQGGRRRRPDPAAGPTRRAVGARRLRDQGLHESPRGDRRVDHRRLAAHRRRRAYLDEDGFIFMVDRTKDMVLRGGENVYCAEVGVGGATEHAAVAECAVFGVPDDRLGEEVGAAVVVQAGAALSADSARASTCAAQIAKHKIPRYLWILDEPLPRNANGKFLKRELRETLKAADAV